MQRIGGQKPLYRRQRVFEGFVRTEKNMKPKEQNNTLTTAFHIQRA